MEFPSPELHPRHAQQLHGTVRGCSQQLQLRQRHYANIRILPERKNENRRKRNLPASIHNPAELSAKKPREIGIACARTYHPGGSLAIVKDPRVNEIAVLAS